MKNFKHLYQTAALGLAMATAGLTACSDAWDDHYGTDSDASGSGNATLLQLVEAEPQLSDFLSLLRTTHIHNNARRTNVTFAELLGGDQSLTVWAPVNGTFNADSLRLLCLTEKGDSSVAQHFVMNHIAHNLYNMNAQTDEPVRMLNEKFLPLTSTALYGAGVEAGRANQPARNGLLHVLGTQAPYTYNIYEALTSLDQFSHLGQFFASYEKQELDENRSIQAGLVDGQKVYSDSVMVKRNYLFSVFDQIMSEDSTFAMLVPDAETWQTVYDQAKKSFNYAYIEKADSVSTFWTNTALLSDLVWNRSVQRTEQDSIFSTSYRPGNWPYHVYYKPYEAGGLMDPANLADSLQCSNGTIYNIRQYPFTPGQIYYTPINVQAEMNYYLKDYDKDKNTGCALNPREAIGDTISGNAYVDIAPVKSTSNWYVTYRVPSTLSAAYDVCAVILPKSVYNNGRDTKPNKFFGTVTYRNAEGEEVTTFLGKNGENITCAPSEATTSYLTSNAEQLRNVGTRVDTVRIARIEFPTCNYGMPDPTVTVTLRCNVGTRETNFSREMFLDCIYLKPVDDTTPVAADSKKRKEVRK